MAKKKENTGTSKKGKEKGNGYSWINELRYGRTLSLELFKQNSWLLLIFVVAIIALMGLRYKT